MGKEGVLEFSQDPGNAEIATIETVAQQLDNLARHPTGGDDLLGEFAKENKLLLESDERMEAAVQHMISEHNGRYIREGKHLLDPDYAANLLIRVQNYTFLTLNKLSASGEIEDVFRYPDEDFDVSLAMQLVLNKYSDFFESNLATQELHSNIPSRYASVKIILPFYSHRDCFKNWSINAIDVGSSIGLGDVKLLNGEPFLAPKLTVPTAGAEIHDWWMANWIQNAVKTPLRFDEIIGFDVMDYDEMHLQAKAHSFYPGELNNVARIDEFERLDSAHPAGFKFFQGDFTKRSTIDSFLENPQHQKKYQLVMFMTVMYRFSEAEVAAAIEHGRELLQDGGIMIIQDKVRPDESAPNSIQFGGSWNEEWIYKTLVLDPWEDDKPVEWLRWKTGRCKEVQTGPRRNLLIR